MNILSRREFLSAIAAAAASLAISIRTSAAPTLEANGAAEWGIQLSGTVEGMRYNNEVIILTRNTLFKDTTIFNCNILANGVQIFLDGTTIFNSNIFEAYTLDGNTDSAVEYCIIHYGDNV